MTENEHKRQAPVWGLHLPMTSSTSSSPRTPFGPFLKLGSAGSNSSSKKIINYAYGYNSIRSKKNWNDSQKDRSKLREGISQFLRNSKASKVYHTHCKIFPKPKRLISLFYMPITLCENSWGLFVKHYLLHIWINCSSPLI